MSSKPGAKGEEADSPRFPGLADICKLTDGDGDIAALNVSFHPLPPENRSGDTRQPLAFREKAKHFRWLQNFDVDAGSSRCYCPGCVFSRCSRPDPHLSVKTASSPARVNPCESDLLTALTVRVAFLFSFRRCFLLRKLLWLIQLLSCSWFNELKQIYTLCGVRQDHFYPLK